MLIQQQEYALKNVLAQKDCLQIQVTKDASVNVLWDIMVTLLNGYVFKVALILLLDTGWMLDDFVLKNAHLHTLLSYQQEHVFKIVVEVFMEMLWREHAKIALLNAQHVFLQQTVFLVLQQNFYLTENVLMNAF